MGTSGSKSFNLDIDEIVEEAHERAGLGRAYSGADYRTARRSLNLLNQEFANKGINLWTIEEQVLALGSGTASYTLPSYVISILDHSIRTGTGTSQSDLNIKRMSLGEWASLTNKNATGRPTKIYIERLRGGPKINIWPIPDNANYSLVYYMVNQMDDASSGGQYQHDAPTRFLPAIVSGLAYQIALKNPNTMERVPTLKQIYDEDFNLAAQEDRDRSDFKITPAIS
jgi:hypothetical protein